MSNDGWFPLVVDASTHFVRIREGKVEHRTEAEHTRKLQGEWASIAARTDHVDAVREIYESTPRADWPLGLRVLAEASHVRAEWVDPKAVPESVSLLEAGLDNVEAAAQRLFPSFMTYARAAIYHMPGQPIDAVRKLRIAGVLNAPPEAKVVIACIGKQLLVFMRATRVPKDLPTGAARATAIRNARRELELQMNAVKLPTLDGVEAASEPGWFESNFIDQPPSVHMYRSIGRYAITVHDDDCSLLSVQLPGATVPFATFSSSLAASALPTTLIVSQHRGARAGK